MNVFCVNLAEQLGPAPDAVGEELTVDETVVTAAALGAGVTHCLVSVKTKEVLATFDGTDPVSSGAGIYLPVTSAPMVWSRRLVGAARFVEAVAGENGVVRFEPMSLG